MAEFLAENNACGQNLLRIVSMGNSIIAEILRLKDYIPDIFRLETKVDQQKYGEVIMDFSYLKIAEAQDLKIEQNPELQDLDDELRENYLDLLTRFYLAFESTHQYASDLQQFIDELNRGYYIQQTLETVLQDEEGKQLMCESLYIFGVILLIVDFHIPGVIRERLLMSYYRYSGSKSHSDSNIDDVCMLLRSTGFVAHKNTTTTINSSKSSKDAVANYPESYFSRFKFEQNFVDMVIGRLRCDDIYNQLSIYPHPDHRSTALSTQAAMLYVCLYFSPKILHSQIAQMREIVDKFFSDNWIISIYMGITVNLVDAWDQFKAAKAALMPVIETDAIKGFCLLHKEKMEKILKQSKEILRDGVLTDYFVLQNITKIINLIRQCNVSLRWYFTHASPIIYEISRGSVTQKVEQIVKLVRSELHYEESDLFELLLNCSQLELVVKEILRTLMQEKTQRWNDFKKEALDRVNELSEAFSGSRPLSKIESNPQLKLWFAEIAQEIEKLNCDNVNISGRTLIQLIQALEEVQEFHNLQANMQVKQYLMETREYLTRMIQIINVKENILINIQLISDLSYAWHLIDRDFTSIMQDSIKKQPKSVIRLRAAFLKLASALEIPLMRINQAKSEDLISVSNYYSSELANYMRKVLQIIPETMFNLMARIIQLQTDVLKEIPTRLEKDKLKEYAQFEDRYTVAKLTYSISVFTEGILMMEKTLVGVIELDPKQLLEDGIRKELVKHLANALNVGLIFTANAKQKYATVELETKLAQLAKTMDGYRRSFEYIQDYLNVHGLKILQQELTRVINYNVEKECNAFLRNKIQDWQSQYQSTTIPIPTFPPLQGDLSKSNNFIGRLAFEILQCTDPQNTIYLDLKAAWYDKKPPHKEVLDSRLFYKVREAIGPAGLVGLDRLYTYMFAADLKKNLDKLQRNIENDKMWSTTLANLTADLESKQFVNLTAGNPLKFYATYHQRWLKVWPTMIEWILQLGHKQILRQQLAFELNRSSKVNAKNLESVLETFNRSILNELENQETQQKFKDNKLLVDIKDYLMYTGSYEPLEQIFVLSKNSHNVALFFFLVIIAHITRLQFSLQTQSLVAKSTKDQIDGTPLLTGLITILQQYHKDVKLMFITYLCQYVKVLVETNLSNKHELCNEAITTLHFLDIFVRKTKLPRQVLSERLPLIILNQYEYLGLSLKS
ncbi:putative WASH complex subunit strumpellin [Lucilia cuprina]|uniref:Putative WASH complex subunit strumpellin n=1 Tax=Lucilia cuprina TaxID=7375 RepID=A0A0L0C4G2_LUCCU|nr:WASH complex subunit like protein 5 [Lucilia cuprina]KNC27258.1 putative WASH complex subunit strumpellin [Lucilia cuprina]